MTFNLTLGKSTTTATHKTLMADKHRVTSALTNSKVLILFDPNGSWWRLNVIRPDKGRNIIPRTMKTNWLKSANRFSLILRSNGTSERKEVLHLNFCSFICQVIFLSGYFLSRRLRTFEFILL